MSSFGDALSGSGEFLLSPKREWGGGSLSMQFQAISVVVSAP